MGQNDIEDTSRITAFRGGMERTLKPRALENLDNCLECGRCGAACTWSLAGIIHPLTRSRAIRDALAVTAPGIFRRKGTEQTLTSFRSLSENVFGSCTMCGRCSLACPYGVGQRDLTFAARGALLNMGLAPQWATRILDNANAHGHTFGRNNHEVWGDLLRRAAPFGGIPLDQPAEWLAVCSAIANTRIPDIAAQSFSLLRRAGVSVTSSWKTTDTGTETHTAAFNAAASARYADRLIATARRLGCSGLIAGECGCDVWWFLVGGAEKLRAAKLNVATFDDLMLDAILNGRLCPQPLDLTVTFHDPCWSGRLTGKYDTPREILRRCVRRIVELEPNREHNYCCTGGGGIAHAYPLNDPIGVANARRIASAPKAEQLRQAISKGVTHVVTSCASCYLSLLDIVMYYGLNIKVTLLNLVLMEALGHKEAS